MNDRSLWIEHVLVPGVRAISTLRGVDPDDYRPGRGAREKLMAALRGAVTPVWMQQVHGNRCVDLDAQDPATSPVADAALTQIPGRAAVVLTADCLPVFLSTEDGAMVAAVHAGWRGLANGIIEATVRQMRVQPASLRAHFGPAIGAAAFEVGPEVKDAFVQRSETAARAFRTGRGDRWHADLYELARQTLERLGVPSPTLPAWCTHSEARFHSWRRDGHAAGRMAHLIWRVPATL